MFNLKFLVCFVVDVVVYWERIFVVIFVGGQFELLMIFYLMDNINFEEIIVAKVFQFVKVVKYYFVGVIINFDFGVMDIY